MLSSLKDKVSRNRILVSNFGYMSLLHFFTIALPLLTYPYLIRVLSADVYGEIVYANSIIAFLQIIIAFGFSISATKEVSENRDDLYKLSKIFSAVTYVKIILFILCFVLLLVLIKFLPSIFKHPELYIITYGLCANEILFPSWLFQGIEKMKYSSLINIIVKIFFTITIFFFVKTKEDYLWVPLLHSIGAIIAGLISFYCLYTKERIKLVRVNKDELLSSTKSSFPFFVSRISGTIFSEGNTFIIGTFLGMHEVAFYDLAKKITNILLLPNSIINTIVYPRLAYSKSISFVKKVLNLRITVAVILYIALFAFSPFFVSLLGGEEMLGGETAVRLYGLMIIITAYNYYLGGTVLVSFNHGKEFNLSVIYSTLMYPILVIILWFFNCINLYSLICTLLIIDSCIGAYRYYYCKKYKLL